MAESSSNSSSSSSSTSSPTVINTPASNWELQLSQAIASQAQDQYRWAQGAYAQLGAITDQQISNYMRETAASDQLAGGLLNQYNNFYAPRQQQFGLDADAYAGEGRLRHEMGAAESRAAQAGQAGQENAEKQLQSFGVDPSSGRYQDLVRASNTATAASAAAAGENARRAAEDTGRQMKLQSIQVGQQLPGQAVNAINAAYQGISGAENAALGRANTGVNLMQTGDRNNQTAMSLKYPTVMPNTQSRSQQQGTSQSQNPSNPGQGGGGNQGGGGGPNTSSGGGNGPGYNPMGGPGGPGGQQNFGGGNSTGINPSAHMMNIGGGGDQSNGGYTEMGGYNPNDPSSNLDAYTNSVAGVYNDNGWQSGANQYDPNAGFGGSTQDNWGSDPYYTGGFGNTNSGGGDWGYTPQNQNWDDSSYGGTSQNAFSDPGYSTPSANWGDYSSASGAGDSYYDSGNSGSSGFDSWYAQGGAVDQSQGGQGGGMIPASMSPSGGQQTDDVPAMIPQTGGQARLNVDEFVIPKDVAMWKGQEFFQKLIAQSRKARTGAPAKPQRGGPNAQ